MIRRVEYQVSVDGADAAESGFDGVARAEDRAADSAKRLDSAISGASSAAKGAAASVPRLGDALERVTGPTGKALQVFNDVGDAFRLLTAGLAGGALFGGLQDIAEAMGTLADKAGLTAMRVDALARSGGTLSADLVARKLEVSNLADAMERYAKSLGVASAAQLTFREQQAALRDIASGRVKTLEGEQKAAEKAEEAIVRARAELQKLADRPDLLVGEITRAGGEAQYKAILERRVADAQAAADAADRAQRGLLGREGANPWVEGVKEFGRSLVTRTKLAVDETAWGLRNQFATYQALLSERYRAATAVDAARSARAPGGARGDGRAAAEPTVTDDEVYSLIYGGREGPRGYGISANMGLMSESNMPGPRSTQVEEGLQAMRESALQTRDAFAEMRGGFSDMWSGMIESSANAAGIVSQTVSTLTGAVGGMMTNMIISGEAGAKGIAKAAGNALAGISAQAYGYAVLLTALAGAAALSGPVLGWVSPGLASAAGIMAAAGTGLAVTARMLGADKLGASSSARSAASGGGGGGYGAATATNPYGGQGQQGTTVQVFIDSEQVAHSVRTRERRMALAGGIMGGA